MGRDVKESRLADLLSVDAALKQITAAMRRLPTETVMLAEALGRVLAEDIQADTDYPPFPNASMDGYAVRVDDVSGASSVNPVSLTATMDIPAGHVPDRPIGAGEAARILTGAPIPAGADAVVPVENTDQTWQAGESFVPGRSIAIYGSAQPGDNIRRAGEALYAGQPILTAGTVIGAAEIGILASIGRSHIQVSRRPRVAVLSTGDELIGIDQPLEPGKIRDSNRYALAALVATYGGEAIQLPTAGDTLAAVRGLFRDALAHNPDMLISSAGVSVGATDLIRTVLDEMGQVSLWRIKMRPGKPLAFGHVRGVPFFGLPGNPVSAMVTFDVMVRPALFTLMGRRDDSVMVMAVTGESIESDGRQTYVRVKLNHQDGRLMARPTGTQSSGALLSMVLADGLLIMPEGMTHAPAGTELSVRLLRR